MNDHTALAANETSEELMLNGGNKPQVKRSSKLPVQISKAGAGGVRQPAKTSHGGECIRNQQSANHGLSKNQIPGNCVHLERSKDKENSELPVMLKSENVQHRYTYGSYCASLLCRSMSGIYGAREKTSMVFFLSRSFEILFRSLEMLCRGKEIVISCERITILRE